LRKYIKSIRKWENFLITFRADFQCSMKNTLLCTALFDFCFSKNTVFCSGYILNIYIYISLIVHWERLQSFSQCTPWTVVNRTNLLDLLRTMSNLRSLNVQFEDDECKPLDLISRNSQIWIDWYILNCLWNLIKINFTRWKFMM